MVDVVELIKSRRTVKQFLPKFVDWDKISKVVDAGRHAPSSGNIQNWKFIVILEPEIKQKVAQASFEQYDISIAGALIVVVSEPEKVERYYGLRGERLYSVQNSAAVAENMLLMAHSLGLGGCWVGAFDEDGLSNALGIIEEVRPQAVLTIGYTDVKPLMPTRYKLENVVFLEKYGNRMKDADAVMGLHYAKVQRGIGKAKEVLDKVNKKVFRRE